jgi:phage terminase large subunit-like protein
LQGWKKPRGGTINLEGIVAEIAETMHAHHITAIYADHYAADWVVQAFARHGITVVHAPERSVAYLELYPLLAQGRLDLLDHPIQARELALLERRQRPGGKVSISHPSAGAHKHDDHANALALAVLMATQNLNAVTPSAEMSAEEIMAIRAAFGSFGPGDYTPNIF